MPARLRRAKTDAPALRRRPPKRPPTKHLRSNRKPLSPSILKPLVKWAGDPARFSRLPPRAASTFLRRVTTRPRAIFRRSDGQLMLAALLREEGSLGGARRSASGST